MEYTFVFLHHSYPIMANKSNIQLSGPAASPDENNPEALRKKEVNKLMKRFGDLIDPPGY